MPPFGGVLHLILMRHSISLVVLFCIVSQAQAQESLRLDEAISIVLQGHPSTAMLDARLAASQGYARSIGSQPNPVLTLSATAGNAGEDANALVQTFEISGQPALRADAANAVAKVRQEELKAQRRLLALETARNYYLLWQYRQLHELATAQLKLAQELEFTSLRRLEEGAISKNQHLRSKLVTASAQSEVAEAAALEKGAQAKLNLLLGWPLERSITLSKVEPLPAPEEFELLQERLAQRPELEAARAQLTAKEFQARLVTKGNAPTLQLSAYQARLGNTGTQGVQLSLVVPLWDWGQQRAREEEAQYLVQAERHSVENQKLELSRDLVEIFARYQAARSKRLMLEEQASDYARLTEMARRGFDAGILTLIEVLETERAYRNNARDYIESRYAELIARFELAHAGLEPILPEEREENP